MENAFDLLISFFFWTGIIFFSLQGYFWYSKKKAKRDLFNKQTGLHSIRRLDWRSFEFFVGEVYRRQGYKAKVVGGVGESDGGIDVLLEKKNEFIIVQCKQWRTTSVSVKVARETFGLMHAHKATKAIIVTCGSFTKDAVKFAEQNKSLELIGGDKLWEMVKEIKIGEFNLSSDSEYDQVVPDCPICGSPMLKRTAKQGINSGQDFFGCSRYPKCKGVVNT